MIIGLVIYKVVISFYIEIRNVLCEIY